MKKVRLAKLPMVVAGLYLLWSCFVYFGSLGRNGHEWWPLFLYFIIWPLSLVHNVLNSLCTDWLFPQATPNWVYAVDDFIAGAFYIVAGTLWVWFLGKLISKVATRLFPLKEIPDQLSSQSTQH